MAESTEHILRGIWNKVCEIAKSISPSIPFTVTGTDCSGAPVTAEATSTVQTVPHLILFRRCNCVHQVLILK